MDLCKVHIFLVLMGLCKAHILNHYGLVQVHAFIIMVLCKVHIPFFRSLRTVSSSKLLTRVVADTHFPSWPYRVRKLLVSGVDFRLSPLSLSNLGISGRDSCKLGRFVTTQKYTQNLCQIFTFVFAHAS